MENHIKRGIVKHKNVQLLRYSINFPIFPNNNIQDFVKNLADNCEQYFINDLGASLREELENSSDRKIHMHFPTCDAYFELDFKTGGNFRKYVIATLNLIEARATHVASFIRRSFVFDELHGFLIPDCEIIKKGRLPKDAFWAFSGDEIVPCLNKFDKKPVRLRKRDLEKYIEILK